MDFGMRMKIRQYVNHFKGTDYDLISMHSWIQ